jgi:hypothetical protein
MMFDVISLEVIDRFPFLSGHPEGETDLESSGIRDANGKICEDGQQFVGGDTPEGKVVCDFVNGKKQVVVRSSADRVRNKDEQR